MNEEQAAHMPEQFDLTSESPTTDRIEGLRSMFPEAFPDGKIDFEVLQRSLGEWIDPGPERFGLNWPGKAECMRVVQESSVGALVPATDESVDWDTTENVIIEGENLEVLKLMQKAYYGKVKLIYIDPPYNTGKEFIYPDNFREGLEDYLQYSGQVSEDGLKLSTNAETDGRYHSNWLSMMYPRLFLARNLLRTDGVIFVSIDDHESHHLRVILDEIFGSENFVATLVWNTEGHTDNQFQIKVMHEYVHVYARSAADFEAGYVVDPNTRDESNLWKGIAENSITKNGPANPPSWITLPRGFPCAADYLSLEASGLDDSLWVEVGNLDYIRREFTQRHGLSYPLRKEAISVTDGALSAPVAVFAGWANRDKLIRFIDGGCEPLNEADGSTLEFFLSNRGVVYYRRHREGLARNIVSVLRGFGTVERARAALEERSIYFDYPKPPDLIQYLVRVAGASDDDLVMDFFAGSGTTAEAVSEVNADDGGRLRWLLVQLPEPSSKSEHSSLSEIPRLRMMVDSSSLKLDAVTGSSGFRFFTLEKSNFKIWAGTVEKEDLVSTEVSLFESNLSESATSPGIVAELLAKAGYELTERVSIVAVANVLVHSVADHQLLVATDEILTSDAVEAMVALSPSMIIVLDRCFGNDDELKVNTLQTIRAANRGTGTNISLKVV